MGEGLLVEHLERRYGERTVLDDVSFAVPHGATAAVIGPNGAGKTTLLRVLAGLLRPHGGRVVAAPRDRIGYLGHETLLHPDLTARENLRFYARLYDIESLRVAEVLDAVGIAERADEPVRTLSRGLLQRVACARACIHAPALLLLDEPWANLDVASAERVRAVLDAEAGPTRVLVTHDVGAALAESDLVIGLRAGRCVLSTPAAHRPDVEMVFA